MTEPTLRENGIFWITDDEPAPRPNKNPDGIAGVLNIANDGSITLEIIGSLSGLPPSEAFLGENTPLTYIVRGVLKGPGHHVILTNASLKSTRDNGLLASETMSATAALLSDEPISLSQFTELKISLQGFEAWAPMGSITAQKITAPEAQHKNLNLTLSCEEERVYETSLGKISIQSNITGSLPFHGSTSIDNSIQSEMVLTPPNPLNLEKLLDYFRGFQDLILLLSNSTRSLQWPLAKHAKSDSQVRIFFRRMIKDDSALTKNSCWLSLERIENEFGLIIDRWFEHRRDLGPGLHLFLGTRRPKQMYVEHKFANLTWGLESLHRRIHNDATSERSKLAKKYDRIIEALNTAEWKKRSDKEFAVRKFRNPEPTLAERIEELISSIDLGFDEAKLQNFSRDCAELRNNLAHYGGEREPGTYSDVIENYLIYTNALNHLYHLLLLSLVGVSPKHINWLTHKHPARVRHSLLRVNLTPRELDQRTITTIE